MLLDLESVLADAFRRVFNRRFPRAVNVTVLATHVRVFSLALLLGRLSVVRTRSGGASLVTLLLLVLFESIDAVLNLFGALHICLLL